MIDVIEHWEVIEPLSYGGSYKITCLYVCSSVCQFSIFLRNGTLVFGHDGRWLECLKSDSPFFQKNSFLPKFGSKVPKMAPEIAFFGFFWKILSLVFLGNNLKWKVILLLMFLHQSHIWQNSGSRVLGQNAVSQSNCRIL